jgi:hypothetical protein
MVSAQWYVTHLAFHHFGAGMSGNEKMDQINGRVRGKKGGNAFMITFGL